MNAEPRVFKINTLRKMAEKYASETRTSDEIFKEDVSEILDKETKFQIENGEIVIEEVKGKPRTGKSTVGIERAMFIDKVLKDCGKKDKKKKFGMRNIARDDQEYSVLMSNPNLMNDVILTDEQNELEKGGENATTEQQLKDVYSDVQAGRYIHRVSCSPEKEIDCNSDILLETVGIDSKEMITHVRVYYRISNAQTKYWQPVGYANISVKELISNWENNVKKVFFKEKKTAKDKEFIKKQEKEDFYVEYMIKKYEKMDLLLVHKILRPRELRYAEAVLNVVNALSGLTKVMTMDDKVIKNYMEIEFKKLGLAFSIVGIKLSSDRASGIIGTYRSYWRTEGKKHAIINELKERGDTEKRIKEIEKGYDENLRDLQKLIDVQIAELKRYMEINRKYNKHLTLEEEK